MAKFIIDIDTDHPLKDETGQMVYRAEKFASLVFDDVGMGKLEPIDMGHEKEPLMVGDFVVLKSFFGPKYGVVLNLPDYGETAYVLTENGIICKSEVVLIRRTGAHTMAVDELIRCVKIEREMKAE